MIQKPVKVYAIFKWDPELDTAELEYLCASEILARRVLEQIKTREGLEGEYFKDGMAFEAEGVYYEIEQETVWTNDPANDPGYTEADIKKARS